MPIYCSYKGNIQFVYAHDFHDDETVRHTKSHDQHEEMR